MIESRPEGPKIPHQKDIPIQAGIEVICGPMFSGKSNELIRRLRYLGHEGRKVQAFTPKIDNRRGGDSVNSEDGATFPATSVASPREILGHVESDTDVVAIDEAQFFDSELPDVCRELAAGGRQVIVAGLDKNFRGEPFGPMARLKLEADGMDSRRAACKICGRSATRTQRVKIINGERIPANYSDPTILVEGTEAYEARCRDHHEVPGKPEGVVLPESVFP